MPFDHQNTPLSAEQARVLATLLEKQRTVPDSYPLTLNSLLSGCNQKTSREPLMQLTEADALAALDALRERHLVIEVSGQRAMRWEHNFERVLGVPSQASALLGLLILRGPQTAAELRTNAERWHRFADTSSVEAFLEELQERSAEKGGPLVQLLPKAPGAREARWAQLLCGEPILPAAAAASHATAASAAATTGLADLTERVTLLEAQVAQLQQRLDALTRSLGD
ncbi:MAG: YceH family protein [Comamonas sp.]|nr:YceH family protein [Comamonas sp.]